MTLVRGFVACISILGASVLVGCLGKEDEVKSYSLKMKLISHSEATRTTESALSGVTIASQQTSTAKAPSDQSLSGTTASDGTFSLRSGSETHTISVTMTDYLDVIAYLTFPSADTDWTTRPLVTGLDGGTSANFCTDTLKVPSGGGFVRIYKTTAAFMETDKLTVTSTKNGADVDSGADLATALTAPGSTFHIDIFENSLTSGDSAGHKNVGIKTVDSNSSATYRATMNGATIDFQFSHCGYNGQSVRVLYF